MVFRHPVGKDERLRCSALWFLSGRTVSTAGGSRAGHHRQQRAQLLVWVRSALEETGARRSLAQGCASLCSV